MNKRTLKNFPPELQPNSEQKADKKQVSPAIANANVSGMCLLRSSPNEILIAKDEIKVAQPFCENPLISCVCSHSLPSQLFAQQIGHNQTKENDNLTTRSP